MWQQEPSTKELALPLPEGSSASRLPELHSWAGCRQGMMLDLLGFGQMTQASPDGIKHP